MQVAFPQCENPSIRHCRSEGKCISVFGTVQSTEVVGAPTVPVDVPTREETKQAFAEVSSVLRDVSTQHDEVQAGMQSLASGVETLRRARAADLETSAQVQATLQTNFVNIQQLGGKDGTGGAFPSTG